MKIDGILQIVSLAGLDCNMIYPRSLTLNLFIPTKQKDGNKKTVRRKRTEEELLSKTMYALSFLE